jgi:hypothetical protein
MKALALESSCSIPSLTCYFARHMPQKKRDRLYPHYTDIKRFFTTGLPTRSWKVKIAPFIR